MQVARDIPEKNCHVKCEHLTVFAGLNQGSAGLNRFKPRVVETGFCRQKPNPVGIRT